MLVLPVVPVLVAVGVVEWVGVPKISQAIAGTEAILAFQDAAGRLAFAAAVVVHTIVCIAAILYFAVQIARFAGPRRTAVALTVAGLSLATVATMVALALIMPPLAIYNYTFYQIADLLAGSPVAGNLLGDGLSVLAVCVLYPSALGIVAVLAATGAGVAATADLGDLRDQAGHARLIKRVHVLLHCFYVLSTVLVTSTLAAALFFRLPLHALHKVEETKGLHTALSSYLSGLGTFWAAVYTLTLFAAFAAPAARIYLHLQSVASGDGASMTVADWLRQKGLTFSLAENIKNALVLIAPLLVGPLGDVVGLLPK
jgi:hypothetical protein